MSDEVPESFLWRGVTRWKCPLCAYDTGSEESCLEHIRWRHITADEVVVPDPAPVVAAALKATKKTAPVVDAVEVVDEKETMNA